MCEGLADAECECAGPAEAGDLVQAQVNKVSLHPLPPPLQLPLPPPPPHQPLLANVSTGMKNTHADNLFAPAQDEGRRVIAAGVEKKASDELDRRIKDANVPSPQHCVIPAPRRKNPRPLLRTLIHLFLWLRIPLCPPCQCHVDTAAAAQPFAPIAISGPR